MKIAIVHDWLVTYACAERVLEQMLKVYPNADLFSIIDFIDDKDRDFLSKKKSKTSFIQNLPFAASKYRYYLPFMMNAIERFNLSRYDLVISSSHAVAKGVKTRSNQLHICMCYSPIRYAWDMREQYLKETKLDKGLKGLIVRSILDRIKIWDLKTSSGVDFFIAISEFISNRIENFYMRSSEVIYPPVDTKMFSLTTQKREEYYVTCSRMVPYKKIDLIVETFSKNFPNKKLIVIGDGPDFKKIKALANCNVTLKGKSDFNTLYKYLSSAKAFIFAAEEDFGISPIEAQSCGTPVIAYGKGGALETVIGIENENPTGIFFKEQTISSLSDAIHIFDKNIGKITHESCRKNAMRFNEKRFRKEFQDFVEEKISEKKVNK